MQSYLSLVKFSHSIFALPFALIGFVVALHHSSAPSLQWDKLVFIIICMITARNAAMAFNRWVDRFIDSKNQRTKNREIPSGIISPKAVLAFIVINSIAFIISAWFINLLCFYLAPIALFIVLGYSYTKRFSWWCHVFLGLGLSLAPVGAYLAVTSSFDLLPLMYGIAVVSWVAGFDVLYALQDIEFDQKEKLYSIPSRFGIQKSLWISIWFHIICAAAILTCSYLLHNEFGLNYFMGAGTISFLILLFYQHYIISENNLNRINLAFFTTNGIASIILAGFTILDFYI
ncbi:MAG: UbiA family prenyltransferase [Saprospiraceae bacterium]|nr:UbiA family prenyltransferase [Saprospiraceae bacterium]